MFVSKPKKVSLTLFCYLALVLAIASVAQADSVHQPVARDHASLNRMIRKRVPQGLGLGDLGTNGAAGDPPSFSSSSTVAASSASASASSAAASQTASSTSASSSAAAQSSSASSSAESSSSASSSAPASSSSASSSSSSVAPSSSSAQPTSTPPAQETPAPEEQAPAQDDNQGSGKTTKTVSVVMSTVNAPQPSDTAGASTVGAATDNSKASKTAITVLAVIGGSIAAVAIGWTIIRKWKFKPSSTFEDRMTPIDWQPSTGGAAGPASDDIPGLRRNVSSASHGSFHSAGHDDYQRGFGSEHSHGGFSNGSDHHGASALQPIPDHDFTAGAALAPVGGYADLARGPSPQPQMAQLNRGPSMNNAYGGYEGGYGAPRY